MAVKERMQLRHCWALGDTVILTALVRDIHAAYPGRFELGVDTHWKDIWQNNPHVVNFPPKSSPAPFTVKIDYSEGIVEAGKGRKTHMLAWYHEDFRRKTAITVPVSKAGGDLHLSPGERRPLVSGRYWLILSGGKADLTAKWWPWRRFQTVVDVLRGYGLRFVQTGNTHPAHYHPPLQNVLNLVGQTEAVRELLTLVAGAEGVICGVTGAMHIAAALEKPCVVIAGGREEPWWEGYVPHYGAFGPTCPPPRVPHRFLHTLGMLPCCAAKGCWKKRTVPIEPDDLLAKNARTLCKEVSRREGVEPAPLCQDLITTDHVVEAVLSYYADGTLPPL